jgi:hypothetical protein
MSSRYNQNTSTYDIATTPDDATYYASAYYSSTSPILEKASDFIMFVERMECSTNGIPFYDASNIPDPANRETITIRSKLAVLPVTTQDVDLNAYSLSHLFEILNSYDYKDPNDDSEFNMTFSIGKDGFIIVSLLDEKTFTGFQIEFPPRLNQILGISTEQQLNGYTACSSSFPRVDMGDDLDHLIIQTTLPTVSDQVGNVRLNVLTDFSSPTSYSNSLAYGPDGNLVRAGFQTNIRQKVIYTPNQRRYIDLIGQFPIYDIRCDLFYVNNEDKLKRVPLPYGGSFEIKLGFYLRNG